MKAKSSTARHVFRIASAAFVSVILPLLMFLSFHGFPKSFVQALEKRVQPEGLVVMIEALRLDIFDGLVVEKARCFRKGELGAPLVQLEKAALSIRPSLATGRCQFAVRIRNGSANLDAGALRGLADACSELRLDNINAFLEISRCDKTVQVRELSAQALGARLTARGTVALPDGEQLPVAPWRGNSEAEGPERKFDLALARELIAQLGSGAGATELRLDADFDIDLDEPDRMVLKCLLEAASLKDGSPEGGKSVFRIAATMNCSEGAGSFSLKNHIFRGVAIDGVRGYFKFDKDRFLLNHFEAAIGEGELRGPLSGSAVFELESGCFEGEAASEFDPRALLAPLEAMGSHAARVIKDFKFNGVPPSCKAEFHGVMGNEWTLNLSGTVCSDEFKYKGARVDSMIANVSAALSETSRVMKLAPSIVVMAGRQAEADMRIDFLDETVVFTGVSTADPRRLAPMIGPFLSKIMNYFDFAGQTYVSASGLAGYSDQTKNNIKVEFEGENIGWNKFYCDEASAKAQVLGLCAQLEDIRGTAYSGEFDANLTIKVGADGGHSQYELEARAEGLEIAALKTAFSGVEKHDYRGTCSASVSLQGLIGEGQGVTASGRGKIEIEEGYIFRIPLFGGLSAFLANYVPGVGLVLRQTDASAEVVIKDGCICSDEILVEGDIFSLLGSGCYSFDGKLSFEARFVLFRQDTVAGSIMRVLALPVSKMFEFKLGGTLAVPRWRPTFLPKELFLIFGSGEDS